MSRAFDPAEPPLFAIDAMHEPDEREHGHLDERGGPVTLEGVSIPFDVLEFGNGQLPDSMLEKVGIGSHRLHATAAAAFRQFRALAAVAGINLTCTDSYRTLAQQTELKERRPQWSATPGRSVHGWGFAVDVSIGSPPKPFGNSVLRWLNENGPPNGWFLGRPKDEPWHWVYRGVAATGPGPTSGPTGGRQRTDAAGGGADAELIGDDEVAVGATGVRVRIVRGQLGLAGGDTFDADTDRAVRTFQSAHGLFVDGKVGLKTWPVLRNATAPTQRPELVVGATGEAVTWLQCRLGHTADGTFDESTKNAVIAYQRAAGLFVDGKVGPKTWSSLTA